MMNKLSPEETLKRFKEWLKNELSSEDIEYSYAIDVVGGALHHIETFGECAPHKISHKQMTEKIKEQKEKYKPKSYIGRCD